MGTHCDHPVHFSADLSYGFIVHSSGHPDIKAYPLTPGSFFQFNLEERLGMDVQTRRDISRMVEDRGWVTIEC